MSEYDNVFGFIKQSSTIAGLVRVAAANKMSLTISFHPHEDDENNVDIDISCGGDCKVNEEDKE